jgi:hypothetical protein
MINNVDWELGGKLLNGSSHCDGLQTDEFVGRSRFTYSFPHITIEG